MLSNSRFLASFQSAYKRTWCLSCSSSKVKPSSCPTSASFLCSPPAGRSDAQFMQSLASRKLDEQSSIISPAPGEASWRRKYLQNLAEAVERTNTSHLPTRIFSSNCPSVLDASPDSNFVLHAGTPWLVCSRKKRPPSLAKIVLVGVARKIAHHSPARSRLWHRNSCERQSRRRQAVPDFR